MLSSPERETTFRNSDSAKEDEVFWAFIKVTSTRRLTLSPLTSCPGLRRRRRSWAELPMQRSLSLLARNKDQFHLTETLTQKNSFFWNLDEARSLLGCEEYWKSGRAAGQPEAGWFAVKEYHAEELASYSAQSVKKAECPKGSDKDRSAFLALLGCVLLMLLTTTGSLFEVFPCPFFVFQFARQVFAHCLPLHCCSVCLYFSVL